jgi:hypothetical protein
LGIYSKNRFQLMTLIFRNTVAAKMRVGTIGPRFLPFLRVSNVHVVQVDEGFRFIYRENRPDVFAERGVGPRPDQGVYC